MGMLLYVHTGPLPCREAGNPTTSCARRTSLDSTTRPEISVALDDLLLHLGYRSDDLEVLGAACQDGAAGEVHRWVLGMVAGEREQSGFG